MNPQIQEEYMSLEGAVIESGYSRKYLIELARNGTLGRIKIGQSVYISAQDLEMYFIVGRRSMRHSDLIKKTIEGKVSHYVDGIAPIISEELAEEGVNLTLEEIIRLIKIFG